MFRSICFHPPSMLLQPCCDASGTPSSDSTDTPRRPRVPVHAEGQTAVILMRHGMTNWNFVGRVQGGLDSSRLNNIGLRQAREAGNVLRHVDVDAVFCSPLTRARDTLSVAIGSSGNRSLVGKKPEFLASLSEIQVPWQGLSKNEIGTSMFSKAYEQYAKNPPRFTYHGFSPYRDIVRRAKDVWQTVSRCNGSCYLMVGHNQMNKALICTALGLPTVLSAWRQGNCCFNVFMLEKGKPRRLRLCNGGTQSLDNPGHRRLRVKLGCMRVVLHQQGSSKSLKDEVLGTDIACFYLVGDAQQEGLEGVHIGGVDGKCVRTPFPEDCHQIMYDAAVQLLNSWRMQHEGEFIVVSVNSSQVLRAFFAASIGMGAEGMSRLVSDAGGVSIVDIRASDPVGTAVTFVEAYNVGAWVRPDPLFGYTLALQEQFDH